MANQVNVLIPMAGEGSRFRDVGYRLPKPFIPIDDKPMIQWVLENLSAPDVSLSFICVIRTEHDRDFDVRANLEALDPRIKVVYAEQLTEGAACTCLLAKDLIDNDTPLLIANSDQFVEWDAAQFYKEALSTDRDGTILCFNLPMELNDTKWSYAKTDEAGNVVDVQEKVVISPHATVGLYFWNRGADYVKCAEQMIADNTRVNNEFYVAPTYNIGALQGAKYKLFDCERMWGLGTPADLQAFEAMYLGKPRTSALEKTCRYVKAFNQKSTEAIAPLLSPNFELTDGNGTFKGREACLEYIGSLFKGPANDLVLDVKNIYEDGPTRTFLEFETVIGGKHPARGLDVIEWTCDPVMKQMRAYVYIV